jgi:predicted AlkP superfamily phosphohydrolase/phosphomutase
VAGVLKRLFGGKAGKVVVLGLDGVPSTLLRKFADEGLMPNVARLIDDGTLCSMTASIPEVSSTSWSTFMTGVNPGRHGIYGFMELRREDYAWKFPNFSDLRSRTIWELAGQHGKRSIVINIPSTYPARPLEGMLVSGFVALDLRKASYPDSLYQYLNGMGYRLDVDAGKAAESMEEFASDIMRTFEKRVEAIRHLHESEDWDLFVAAVTETDRLHHYLWGALEDPSHRYHDFFLGFYRALDRFIGSFYDRIGPETPFVMLSDHGFSTIKKEVYLNFFLRQKGYLSFATPNPTSFGDMSSDSEAFVLDPSRVYIHRRDRYPRGPVQESRYGELREALKEDLLALEVNGERVIKEALFSEDLYSGDCLPDAPDLVLLPAEGYDLKGSITRNALSGNSLLTGGHTRENAVFYINRKTGCDNPNIVDVGATVLKLLGVKADGLDGRPLV